MISCAATRPAERERQALQVRGRVGEPVEQLVDEMPARDVDAVRGDRPSRATVPND